ncbi:MAG: elastin [Longicatena sp.]
MESIKTYIDEKATVKDMKQRLEYLRYYSAGVRLQSILYGEYDSTLRIEDEIGDYLQYTKSVVQIDRNASYHERENVVLQAMHRQQKHKEQLQKRDLQAYILLEGIAQMKKSERELLFDVYVRQRSKQQVMKELGGIVESTYHRKLHKAMLHLALILHYEIYKDH